MNPSGNLPSAPVQVGQNVPQADSSGATGGQAVDQANRASVPTVPIASDDSDAVSGLFIAHTPNLNKEAEKQLAVLHIRKLEQRIRQLEAEGRDRNAEFKALDKDARSLERSNIELSAKLDSSVVAPILISVGGPLFALSVHLFTLHLVYESIATAGIGAALLVGGWLKYYFNKPK